MTSDLRYVHYAIELRRTEGFVKNWDWQQQLDFKKSNKRSKSLFVGYEFCPWAIVYNCTSTDRNLTKAQRKELEHGQRHYVWESYLHEPKDNLDELFYCANY